MAQFNDKFAVPSARPEDLHRPLSMTVEKLTDILCHREQRYVGAQLTLTYDRKRIILERNPLSEGLTGKYVDVYDFPNGHLEVRTKGLLLPYRVFSKDQRISHTAIVENKRLGHALAVIKAQQNTDFTPKVSTNSQKNGYQKRSRNVYGPDYIAPAISIADGHPDGVDVVRSKASETLVEQVKRLPRRVLEQDEVSVSPVSENTRLGRALAVAERLHPLGLPPKMASKKAALADVSQGRKPYGPDYFEAM